MFAYVYAWDEGAKEEESEDLNEVVSELQNVQGSDELNKLAHFSFIEKAHALFMHKNALNPIAFQGLRRYFSYHRHVYVRMCISICGHVDVNVICFVYRSMRVIMLYG